MGIVHRAYDLRLRREVALKRIRPGQMSPDARARLVREARAMARLSHPNVVAVYDIEQEQGSVTVVMQYVHGTDLRTALRTALSRERWSAPRILQMFIDAGQGLEAAHRAGLLHRDFKPANVLLGSDGRVRVTDFGLARSAESFGTEADADEPSERDPSEDWGQETVSRGGPPSSTPDLGIGVAGRITVHGAVVGSPVYMAPEQHLGRSDLGPEADQYAFCVSLWQALVGEPPFVAKPGRMRRLARAKMDGPPSWPGGVHVPARVGEALRRGLAPDPRARFSSMQELLVVLEDAASHRRRWMFGASMGAGALVVGGLWSGVAYREGACTAVASRLNSVWNASTRASVAAAYEKTDLARAPEVWHGAEERLDAYIRQWTAMRREVCERARGDLPPAVVDRRVACLRRARAHVAAVTELLQTADAAVVDRTARLTQGLPVLADCEDDERLVADVELPRTDEQTAAVALAHEWIAQAKTLNKAGRYGEAADLFARVDGRIEELEHLATRSEVHLIRGSTWEYLGRNEQAVAELSQALTTGLESAKWSVAVEAAHELSYVVGNKLVQGDAGHAYGRLALGLSQRPGVGELRRARVHDSFAGMLAEQGRYDEARSHHEIALAARMSVRGPRHLDVAESRNNLGTVLWRMGDYDEAQRQLADAVDIFEDVLGSQHPDLASGLNNLANVEKARGRLDEAARLHRRALAIREAALGPEHFDVAVSLNNLANVHRQRGDYEEAERLLRRALESLVPTLGAEHPDVASVRNNLANVLQDLGRSAEAEQEHQRIVAVRRERLGPEHPRVADSLVNLALARKEQGRLDEARTTLMEALEIRERALGAEHPEMASARAHLPAIYEAQGRLADATRELEQVVSIRRQSLRADHPSLAESYCSLARVAQADGRGSERDAWLEQARQVASPEDSDVCGFKP